MTRIGSGSMQGQAPCRRKTASQRVRGVLAEQALVRSGKSSKFKKACLISDVGHGGVSVACLGQRAACMMKALQSQVAQRSVPERLVESVFQCALTDVCRAAQLWHGQKGCIVFTQKFDSAGKTALPPRGVWTRVLGYG